MRFLRLFRHYSTNDSLQKLYQLSLIQHKNPSRANSKNLVNHVSWLLEHEKFSNLEMLLALPTEHLFEEESLSSIISLKRTYGLEHIIDMFVRQSTDQKHLSKVIEILFKFEAEIGVKILLRDSRVRFDPNVLYPVLMKNMPEFNHEKFKEFLVFAGLDLDEEVMIRSLAAIHPKQAFDLFMESKLQYDSIELYDAICEGLIVTGNVPLIMKITEIAEKNNFIMGLQNLYVAQIRASGKKGSKMSPAKVLKILSEKINIQNPVLMAEMMHAYIECGKYGAVIPIYHSWKKTGEPPTLGMFQAVFRVLVKAAKATRKYVSITAKRRLKSKENCDKSSGLNSTEDLKFEPIHTIDHKKFVGGENPFDYLIKNKNFFKKEMIKYWVMPCPEIYSSLLEFDYFIGFTPTFYKVWKVLHQNDTDDYDYKMFHSGKYGYKIMLEWSFEKNVDIKPLDIWKLFPDKIYRQDTKRVLQYLIGNGGEQDDIDLVQKKLEIK